MKEKKVKCQFHDQNSKLKMYTMINKAYIKKIKLVKTPKSLK